MEVIDINGRKRNVQSIKRITQQIPDAINGGIAVTKEYIEVVIIGKTRTWIEWYPLEDFEKSNIPYKIDLVDFSKVDKNFKNKVKEEKIIWLT